MDIGYFLKLMVDKDASDMFLTTGAPVHVKVQGRLQPIGSTGLPEGAYAAALGTTTITELVVSAVISTRIFPLFDPRSVPR